MKRLGGFVVLSVVFCVCVPAFASAAIVNLGLAPSTQGLKLTEFAGGGPGTAFNTKFRGQAGVAASPVNGVVISWSTLEARGGPFRLRIIQPNPDGTYTATGTSASVLPAAPGTQVYPTLIPIKAGQLVGIDNTSPTDEIGVTGVAPGFQFAAALPPMPDGTPVHVDVIPTPIGIGFNAQVLPAPTATTLSTPSGSIKGGTTVTITGTDLDRATAVAFGTAPAKSIRLVSETQITAVSPPSKKIVAVPVSVTTPAGTAIAAQTFAYEGCKVPNLKSKKLKQAKKRAKKSDCKVGKVKLLGDATKKTGEVAKQNPKAGKILAPGSKVSVKLD